MKYAILDIGANSIRLCVYEEKDNAFKTLFTKKVMAGLAYYVKDGEMSNQGIIEASNVINDFKELVNNFNIENFYIFATASFRNITNTDFVVMEIEKLTGEKIEVISGEDEALYGFRGAKLKVKAKSGIVVDIGGGSTEIVDFEKDEVNFADSLPIGSLNLYSMYVSEFLPNEKEQRNIKNKIQKVTKEIDIKHTNTICGVGGTIKAALKLTNSYFKLNKNNTVIKREQMEEIEKILLKKPQKAKNIIIKACPDRVHTIIPGVLILDEILKRTKAKEIIVSKYGVREGYLCQKIMQKKK